MPVPCTVVRKPAFAWASVLALLLLCTLPGFAVAQDAAQATDDAPSRVARLSYVEGDLGLLPAGAQDWSDVRVNRPLTTGDRLSSGNDARAELELGGASLRMDAGTDIGFLNLNEQLAQVELTRGTLNISVRDVAPGQSYEIDTPTIALVLDAPGVYRVDINADGGVTSVTAFSGDATAYGENGVRQLLQGDAFYRFEDSGLRDVRVSDIRGEDSFDRWSAERDARYADSRGAVYAANDMVGVQDLDQYGQWQDDDEYGHVWYPDDVASDWAPYQNGQWAWIDPWGWTWVDNAPWGFAPFHYGRWGYVHNRWGWIPGPRGVRSVYAPALVAFVGGNTWGVSIGFGGSYPVGWFPLGPGDIYDPWYRYSRNYYTQVNITNIYVRDHRHRQHMRDRLAREYGVYQKPRPLRDIHYANRHAPHATTVVGAKAFTSGGSVRAGRLHVNPKRLHDAPVLADVGAVHALRPAVAHRRPAPMGALPLSGFERQVVAHHVPASKVMRHEPQRLRGTDRANPDRAADARATPAITNLRPRVRVLKGAAPESPRAWKPRIADQTVREPDRVGINRIEPGHAPRKFTGMRSESGDVGATTLRKPMARTPKALPSSVFVPPRTPLPRVVDRDREPTATDVPKSRTFVQHAPKRDIPARAPIQSRPDFHLQQAPERTVQRAQRDTPAPRPWRAPPTPRAHATAPQTRTFTPTPQRTWTPPPVRSEKRQSHTPAKRAVSTDNDDDKLHKRRPWKH